MQSELQALPPAVTSIDLPERAQPSSQHGLHKHDADDFLPPEPSTGTEAPTSAERVGRDTELAVSLRDASDAPRSQPQRLITRTSLSPPAYNRIAEYERASTPSVRKREGPAFEVLKKTRSPHDKRSPVQDMPNEVLTHAFAHLTPSDLASVALVCKRFHNLVNGPHAWRSAFAHYFPGSESVNANIQDAEQEQSVVRAEKRYFTRLTALASWRSEYIIRTRLLRSLARGKPVQSSSSNSSSRLGHSNAVQPFVTYKSQLLTTINHLHATFGNGNSKKLPRFIHGADDVGCATSSDPNAAKVDAWGLSDPQVFLQFADRFPGDAPHGLGPGETIGIPNPMDISQPFGMVYGEGFPGGMTYFRSTEEMRGRFLAFSSAMSVPHLGIPKISSSKEAVTAVWVAKSSSIPSLSDGVIGILSGSSSGVLTAYSLGPMNGNSNRDQRFDRGAMTARWVLSPGVPLVAIAIDNEYSSSRYAQNRIWAVVINALGEVFYLTKFPKRPRMERGARLDDEAIERNAWITGRSVYWNIIELSRRVARIDPYADSNVDGSYSPRTSWTGMCLSPEQIEAETREIEDFTALKPKDFLKSCVGWDMHRDLQVDFAGDDCNYAGENVLVFTRGFGEEGVASITRYARLRVKDRSMLDRMSTPPLTSGSTEASSPPSVFGTPASPVPSSTMSPSLERLEDSLSCADLGGSVTPRPQTEEWRSSIFSFSGLKQVQITSTAMDSSTFATQTISEDHLFGYPGTSAASSPTLTPPVSTAPVADSADIPGQRARLFAIGTKLGSVLVWDARAPTPRSTDVVNTIEPVRVIHTDSPEISCVALSSLYLVHGGNDGLVQTWDIMGSNMMPIRTLHSRFSSRARRDLARANASPQGVGINLYAAGAICLDPDPTVLRGMVSLGNQLRYWSFSSSAADQYKSHKRRLRHGQRGSNAGGNGFSGGVRSNLKDYIANERLELDREKTMRRKESERFAGRFGTDLLDGSEEEMIAYAAMLSQESLERENLRRESDTSTATSTAASSNDRSTWAPIDPAARSPSPVLSTTKSDDDLDADLAEAIRQSLATSTAHHVFDIPLKHAKPKGRKGSSARPSPKPSPMLSGSSKAAEMNDLDFALQLSLAEEQSKQDLAHEAFPSLSSPRGGGKGKSRIS